MSEQGKSPLPHEAITPEQISALVATSRFCVESGIASEVSRMIHEIASDLEEENSDSEQSYDADFEEEFRLIAGAEVPFAFYRSKDPDHDLNVIKINPKTGRGYSYFPEGGEDAETLSAFGLCGVNSDGTFTPYPRFKDFDPAIFQRALELYEQQQAAGLQFDYA